MQISASAETGATLLSVVGDDAGPYDAPRGLVLALQGAEEAQDSIVHHLYATGQVQPGDVIALNFPDPGPLAADGKRPGKKPRGNGGQNGH